jgi:hypothetical protein
LHGKRPGTVIIRVHDLITALWSRRAAGNAAQTQV